MSQNWKNCRDDINIDASRLKVGEKIVYDRDSEGRVISVEKRDGNSCWVVTAYYGHPYHENVCKIRSFKDKLIGNVFFGYFFLGIYKLYLFIGSSNFGSYWKEKVNDCDSIQRKISGILCNILLKFSK